MGGGNLIQLPRMQGTISGSVRDSVNLCLKEGKTEPKMLSVGLHGRIIGRPGRASALERFLEFCQATEGIWVARRDEIARWWYKHYP